MKQECYSASRKQIIRLLETMLKSHHFRARAASFSFEEIKNKAAFLASLWAERPFSHPKIFLSFGRGDVHAKRQPANGESGAVVVWRKINEPKAAKPAFVFVVHPVDLYGILQLDESMANPNLIIITSAIKGAILIGINQAKEINFWLFERWGILKNNIPEAFDIFLKE